MDFDHDRRLAGFHAWTETPLQERIGSGKYGEVFVSGAAAAKRLDLRGRSRGSRRQAFREHVVGLLQTLLLLERATPHLPWHYGARFDVEPEGLGLSLFMERFDLSLAAAAPLPQDAWRPLLFQLLHAVGCLSFVFGVSHNDAYPRNILLRRYATPRRVRYEVFGRPYEVEAPFLAAVTDYGIASGELLGAPGAPEVASKGPLIAPGPRFSVVPPREHILRYDLPPYSRDAYTLLKLPVYGSSEVPPAPLEERLWGLWALSRVDAGDFTRRSAPLRLLEELFPAAPHGAAPAFRLAPDLRQRLLPRACELLKAAALEDAAWAREVSQK